uniref:tripartite tricarboxylate transporter TctB family protein n=1 Tax=Pararhizobium sp. IMCC3301 TaxID=3067904 RepID=UPI00274049B3|nr:tripartite tricarboxylate transporter TctB family protein [Pararhizobium sp. IMCC3301]
MPSRSKQPVSETKSAVSDHARSRDKVAGVVVLVASTATLIASYLMPLVGEGLDKFLAAPGLTPALLSIFLILLSLVLIARNWSAPLTLGVGAIGETQKRMMIAFAIIVFYIASLYVLPYLVSTFFMMFAFQFVFASRERSVMYVILWCGVYSAAISGALYYVFGEVFYIPLP